MTLERLALDTPEHSRNQTEHMCAQVSKGARFHSSMDLENIFLMCGFASEGHLSAVQHLLLGHTYPHPPRMTCVADCSRNEYIFPCSKTVVRTHDLRARDAGYAP